MTPKGDGQEIVREHTFPARLRKLSYLIGRAGRVKFAALFVLMIANAILEMAGIGAIPLFILILSSPETVLKIRGPVQCSPGFTSSRPKV